MVEDGALTIWILTFSNSDLDSGAPCFNSAGAEGRVLPSACNSHKIHKMYSTPD